MSDRVWTRCPVCGAVVTDMAEHDAIHDQGTQRVAEAMAEACAAKEEALAARAEAADLLARVEALVTQVEQSQAAVEQNRAEIANLKARNPAQPPAKGQNSGG